jgi:hypothetical protein
LHFAPLSLTFFAAIGVPPEMRAQTTASSFPFRTGLLLVRLMVGLCICLFLSAAQGFTQSPPQIQTLTGSLERGERKVYDLPHLKKDDTLYLYMARASGNLDPLIAVADARLDLKSIKTHLRGMEQQSPEQYFRAFRELLDSSFLAWDDDSGRWSDAALKIKIPADGDYQLMVTGAGQDRTFGDYRLLVGINAPAVLSGQATPTGQVVAKLNQPSELPVRIQEIQGSLTPQRNSTYYRLRNMDPGTTLYVRVQTTSGNLKPALVLKNYGGKIIREDNVLGLSKEAQFQYTFTEESPNYSLELRGVSEDNRQTAGSYRLLIGLDAPQVLKGEGEPVGLTIVREPIKVKAGIFVDQITEVNQRGENYGAVGDLVLEWRDPAYAFNPDTCKCTSKTLSPRDFERFNVEHGLKWPRFVFFNQQGKRWSQGETFWIFTSGRVQYYERFSATFQAPDFDFRRFPFDTQKFFIHLESVDPEEEYVFTFYPEYTGLGKQLGEEEWYFVQHSTKVSSTLAPDGAAYSRYSFQLLARRHLSYYIFRIFIPLLLISMVSWVAFFLKDYAKRVDISGANLLVFIAFNFTIGSDLPRLGYLTFLDTILIIAFVVTALAVIFNVALKRLESLGKTELTQKIDTCILWGYPLFYAVGMIVLILIFFL